MQTENRICRNILTIVILAIAFPVFAQISKTELPTDSLTGIIVDITTQKPVNGAKIQSVNAKYASMTDESGLFNIKFPTYIRTIIVSAPGYENKEVVVFVGEKSKNIGILPVGQYNFYQKSVSSFGNRRSSTLSTSISSIDFTEKNTTCVDNAIKNNFSGDMNIITNSGAASAGLTMLLRGINSINATNSPLIVIDGIIFDNRDEEQSIHLGNTHNPLAVIDVNDIQNISVLKDGTAIYGSKGANGVILVNTNRGRNEATQITLSATLGYNSKPNTIPVMNASQYRVYLSDLLKSPAATNSISNLRFLNDDENFVYYKMYHNNTNWANEVYTNAPVQSYNIGVNGGDEIALYNLSVGYHNSLNTIKENSFTRINTRFNSDIELARNLNVAFDVSYSQTDKDIRNDGISESGKGQVNSPGFLALIKSPILNPYKFDNSKNITSALEDYDFLGVANPFAVLDYGVGKAQQKSFNLSLTPSWKLNKNLTIFSRFSYTDKNLSENAYSPIYGVAPFVDVDNHFISRNYVKTQYIHQTSIFSDTRVNFKKSLKYSSFDLNAGVRVLSDIYQTEYAFGHNTGSDQVKEMSSSLGFKTVNGIDDPYKLITYYGQLNYDFYDKYFIEAGFSAETSSRFGNETLSGIHLFGVSWAAFPSMNAAWLVSSENFMKDIKFIDQLKLRAGYGLSGNDDILGTASRAYLNAVQLAYVATGVQINNLGNTAVQWETVTKRNIGVDANLFNSRLSVSFDVYNNTTDNLLNLVSPQYYSGIDSYWQNGGKLENKGVEVRLNAVVLRSKDLYLSLGASMSKFKNKILQLPDGDYLTTVYGGTILTAINQPIGQFYGYMTDGVFSTTEDAQNANLSVRSSTGTLIPLEAGDEKFIDRDGNNIIDEKDRIVIGNSTPDLYGSFDLNFKYKRLEMKGILNYSYGNDVYNYLRSQLESGSTFYNQSVAINNRWLTEGQITDMPKSVYGDPKGNNRFSNRWIEDGSYLKLKSIEVSYDLPVNKISFLQGVKIWASVNDIFTITNYLGSDPEFSSSSNIYYRGIDTGLIPASRSYYAGVKINL